MFRELFQMIWEFLKNFFTSRLFILAVIMVGMMATLTAHLFQVQIVQGESYQNDYISKTLTTVKKDSSRGAIFDRNGKPLAYNKLAYSVTVMDTGDYNGYERNLMLLELRKILMEHGETIVPSVPIDLDENENYIFTAASESRRLAFLRDAYGKRSVEELDTEDEILSASTAQDMVDWFVDRYGIGKYKPKGPSYELTKQETLDLIHMRYAMALNSYQKYMEVTVSQDVDIATVSDVLEHSNKLKGVDVKEDSIRVYEDSEYFSNIIGYIGQVDQEELDALKTEDGEYAVGDMIGKTGIEASMESELRGTKGEQVMYVDSQGHILEVVKQTDPLAGNDIYLNITAEEQKAIYCLLEQRLAGILVSKIVNEDVTITPTMSAEERYIPVKDVYYQLIGNNVLSVAHFSDRDASETERGIYAKYVGRKQQVMSQLSQVLFDEQSMPVAEQSEAMQSYIAYAHSILTDNNILVRSWIDTDDPMYQQWREDTCSFRDFLFHALTNGWIDTRKLDLKDKYSSTEDTFAALVDKMEEILDTDTSFGKQIYRYLVEDETLTGRELCLALFDQGVLKYDEAAYQTLAAGGDAAAFTFIKQKIANIEITPAQLALDPCSGSVVVSDVKTGNVLALVSYPGSDNNLLMSDPTYFAKLQNDQSLPLYPRVTQTRTAPGSTFKMVSAIAGMEEGVLQPTETIATQGIFTELGLELRCNVYPGIHGVINIQEALAKSCNYFYSEVGYRLSQDAAGSYNAALGLSRMKKYSEAFGFGEKSGVEIYESDPHITDENPIPSAIGQGSHSYTNTQFNRYALTLANRGTTLKLNLISHINSPTGAIMQTFERTVTGQSAFSQDSWDTVWEGMRRVITDGSYNTLFADTPVTVAGKTGTAEENKLRPNHANFVCFAPYESPQVAVTVSIPNGYTAANAVLVAKDVLDYHFGKIDLDSILNSSASDSNVVDENE